MPLLAWREILAGIREGWTKPTPKAAAPGFTPPDTVPGPATAPPDWTEVPAFLRRCGPLLSPSSGRYDEMLAKHERLATAHGVRIAADAVYDITHSRWLAQQLEALAARMQADADR